MTKIIGRYKYNKQKDEWKGFFDYSKGSNPARTKAYALAKSHGGKVRVKNINKFKKEYIVYKKARG